MIKLNSKHYLPKDYEVDILDMLYGGETQVEMAVLLKIPEDTMYQRLSRLRENMGATSNEQLMYHYGQYKARTEDAGKGTVRPTRLLQCAELKHCLSCPKGKAVRAIKKFVEDMFPRWLIERKL